MRIWSWVAMAWLTACPPPGGDTGPPKTTKAPEPPVREGIVAVPDASKAQICADDCLLLTRYDVHTLKHRFKELCCQPDGAPGDARCQTGEWPFPKDQPCKGWKRLEMCVYAKHGYVFKEDSEWKPVFEKEPWYQPNGAFNNINMTILVKRNTSALRTFQAQNIDCGQVVDTDAPK